MQSRQFSEGVCPGSKTGLAAALLLLLMALSVPVWAGGQGGMGTVPPSRAERVPPRVSINETPTPTPPPGP